MDKQNKLTADEAERLKLQVKKAQAVREAMFEVVNTYRKEIVTRAQEKLRAQGIELGADEVGEI